MAGWPPSYVFLPMKYLGWIGLAVVGIGCASNEETPTPPGDDEGRQDTVRIAECGNGVLDADEICEGFELRGATCASAGFDAGRIACTAECTLDTSACTQCGDGVISDGEVCEPGMVQGEDCSTQLGPGFVGAVSCDPFCTGFTSSECRLDFAAGALEACNPEGAVPCSTMGDACVDFGDLSFCAEACDPQRPPVEACGENRFCYVFDEQGICLDVPERGEVCSPATGCANATACTPTFDGQGLVSTCTVPCSAFDLGEATGCDAGEICLATPAEDFAFVSDIACETDDDCPASSALECAVVESPVGTRPFCVQPHAACAQRIEFFPFDDGPTRPELLCDRDIPGAAPRYCGVEGALPDPAAVRARVQCVGLVDDSDAAGICVGFCDAAVVGGDVDGFCGDNATCGVPPGAPRFYIVANEDKPVACDGTFQSCSLRTEFTECLDVGRGLECVRPARICQENTQ